MGTIGLIGALCCVLWITLFSTSEAGELREGKHNRTMTAQAQIHKQCRGVE